MKKIFLIIIVAVLGCVAVYAAQLTPAQKKAKTEIFNALKKYGTNISDDGDETLSFRYNGTLYHTSIHTLNSNTLYLSLGAVYALPEECIPEVANIAAFNAAINKPVCSFADDNRIMFSCEMYAKDAKTFISVLPDMLQALESCAENFQPEYEKAVKDYVPDTRASATLVTTDDNTFIYPKIASRDDSKLYIEKVTLDPYLTILDMVSYNGGRYQWCDISKNSYLSVNGKHYNLKRAEGIDYSPQHTDYPGWESGRDVSLHFKLYFPALPKGTTSFDFSEGGIDGWHLTGIELKHGKAYAISGDQVETDYHTWDCTGIEVQDGQTIVTKTVRPKLNGTTMYSSQDEYIEDAETGGNIIL